RAEGAINAAMRYSGDGARRGASGDRGMLRRSGSGLRVLRRGHGKSGPAFSAATTTSRRLARRPTLSTAPQRALLHNTTILDPAPVAPLLHEWRDSRPC